MGRGGRKSEIEKDWERKTGKNGRDGDEEI